MEQKTGLSYEQQRILLSLMALLHGADLVDTVWYPRSGRLIARLRGGARAVYTADGEYIGADPIRGERGHQLLPPRSG